MYKCKLCGNSKEFKERNCYITHLFLEDGEIDLALTKQANNTSLFGAAA